MKTKLFVLISLMILVFSLSSCNISGLLSNVGQGDGSSSGSGDTSSGSSGHNHSFGEWSEARAATCLQKGREARECSACTYTEYRDIPTLEHTATTDVGRLPSCTEEGISEGSHCSVCETVLVSQEVLPVVPHTEAVTPATDKKTEGKHCSVCGTVLVRQEWIIATDFVDAESYNGSYGYTYLAGMTNGKAMQDFYLDIDAAADKFHVGEDVAEREDEENGEYIVEKLDYSKHGLTPEEAITVWSIYRDDRPLYYWIASNIKYTSKELYLIVDEEYADTTVRLAINDGVYERVEEIFGLVGSADSSYALCLAINDEIVESSSYAYVEGTLIPSTAPSAHNILGILLYGKGVCESYAKSFQLLLNYAEVENVLATGDGVTSVGTEAHAWNMAKMDDGEWYYFDLTWNDQPNLMLGKQYNYFCISEYENVRWSHGDSEKEYPTVTFTETHIPSSSAELGPDFLYELPSASKTPYENVEICKTTFTKDGLKYVVCGYLELQLYEITVGGAVVIPSEVSYDGITYSVVSVGRFADGVFEYDYISDKKVTSVTVPATVEHIWIGAFNIPSLEEILVSPENLHYSSDGGILYSKDFSEFLWIPQSKSGEVIIRSEVTNYEDIVITYCPYIASITLPSGIDQIAESAFKGCSSLTDIYFDGTAAEWNALPKGNGYNALNTQRITVHCTDVSLTLE